MKVLYAYVIALVLIKTLTITDSSAENSIHDDVDTTSCVKRKFGHQDLKYLENGQVYIPQYNITVPIFPSDIIGRTLHVCYNDSENLIAQILNLCEKYIYLEDEFEKLENGSVIIHDEILHNPGTFEIEGNELFVCNNSTEEDDDDPDYQEDPIILVSKICCSISIVALIANLLVFIQVPSLRNLPGYSLASLSIAFLFAFLFILIGQIPQVLGLPCVLSGIFQQYFLLTAFFCMNVMSFDVWRTLRLATSKLTIRTDDTRRRQFVYYLIYSWGVPAIITLASVIADNVENTSPRFKPEYGKQNMCSITNQFAKTIYFQIPSFTLFAINGVFLISSGIIIKRNTMQGTSDVQTNTVNTNFALYVRLGLMMGVTWLVGIVAQATNTLGTKVVWYIFDVLNSLQGLFLFLLSCFSKKVFNHFRSKLTSKGHKASTETSRHTASTNKSESDRV